MPRDLLNLYLTSITYVTLFGVFLPRKIITIVRKIAVKFRPVLQKGALLSVNVLECFGYK